MGPIKNISGFKASIVVLTSLVLGGGLFGLGFWQGTLHLKKTPEQAIALAKSGPRQMVPPANIPPNASPEMKEFLENQTVLAQKMDQLRGPGANGVISPQSFAQFHEQNADLLKRQNQLAQIIGQQQQAKSTLPPLQIPPKATPQLQAYLKARDQLMRDQIAFMNKHSTDNLAAKEAAMQQWRQQNASRFQQLQQLTQGLGKTAISQ